MKRLIRKIAVAVLVVIGAFAALPAKATPHFINDVIVNSSGPSADGNGFVLLQTGLTSTTSSCCFFVFINPTAAITQALVSAMNNRDAVRFFGTSGEIGTNYNSQALVYVEISRDPATIPPHPSTLKVPYKILMFNPAFNSDFLWYSTNISGFQVFSTLPTGNHGQAAATYGAVAAVMNAFSGKYGVTVNANANNASFFDIDNCNTLPSDEDC